MIKNLERSHFETLSKTVYSHGLEAIYALETIDITTLKRMEEPKKVPQPQKPKMATFSRELPFENRFRETLPATLLALPIECINLSKPLIVRLKERFIVSVSDLWHVEQSLLSDKALGQSYIDELRNFFEAEFNGRDLDFSKTIDWVSFLKGIFFPIDKRAAYLLLQEFQLEDLIQIPLSLKLSVRTISDSLRRELIDEAKRILRQVSLKPFIDVFVIPWMRGRFCVARRDEIVERLANVGEGEAPVATFLCDLVQGFETCLTPVSENLFTVDSFSANRIGEVEALARSYFYSAHIVYPLDTLVAYLLKDLASQFFFTTPEEIEALLKYLPSFRVRRDLAQTPICHLI